MTEEEIVGIPKEDLERLADAYGVWLFGTPHGSSLRDTMEACLEAVLESAGFIDRVRSHQRPKK